MSKVQSDFIYAAPLLVFLVQPVNAFASLDPQGILEQLSQTAIRTPGYTVVQMKRERFGEQLSTPETMALKYSRGRVYLHVLSGPRQGAEALYVPGWNNNKVRIHKGSFPDVTVNLDPHGSLLMDGQHHPIEHAGFDHLVSTLVENVRRAQAAGEGQMRLLSPIQVGGRAADVLEMATPHKATAVQVAKGEDLFAFARRVKADPYVLLHENELRKPGQVKGGMTLQVPSYYGTRSVLAVDRKSHLPARLEVYDSKGRLYELYEWSALEERPLPATEFAPDNPAYRF